MLAIWAEVVKLSFWRDQFGTMEGANFFNFNCNMEWPNLKT
jgi:hypothetical protein